MRSPVVRHFGLLFVAFTLGLMALSLTIGGTDPSWLTVTGTVKVNGKPLDRGIIRFMGASQTHPTAVGALIGDGSYEIRTSQLLVPDTYQIQISGLGLEATPVPQGQEIEAAQPAPREWIPARYNSASVLNVQITRGGSHRFNFDLKF